MATPPQRKRSWSNDLDPQKDPSLSCPRTRRRKRKLPNVGNLPSYKDSSSPLELESQSILMDFGSWEMPQCDIYYRTHVGICTNNRLRPLFTYPVEVLANCRNFRLVDGTIQGSGCALVPIGPPHRLPELSKQEFYALWAEDTLRGVAAFAAHHGAKHKKVRRYRRNLEVLNFMRATWDAVLTSYQIVRSRHLPKYGVFLESLNSRALQGINRFRIQLVFHPVEAAKRAKRQLQANRSWYFGGPRPVGRLLIFKEKIDAMRSSYSARALPPAPPDPAGLVGLVERLTSDPAPEPQDWRSFIREYITRWAPKGPPELFTMPSSNAALGYPRMRGGHMTGVQHLLLTGYAVCRSAMLSDEHKKYLPSDDPYGHVEDGSYLELLSDQLNPGSQLKPDRIDFDSLFRQPWDVLESKLPGVSERLQFYVKIGVFYVLDRVDYLPILPIAAEEKGLKTRFPTCSLTAANLVQQILRRVLDHVMVQDPRFSQALGGHLDIDLRGEVGPWYSQDATAATDLHAQWLTQTIYEELAIPYSKELSPYLKYFNKIFGVKKLLVDIDPDEVSPHGMFENYPRAPLLDDSKVRSPERLPRMRNGHATLILEIMDQWIDDLNSTKGVMTTTGQMMGDPTSFPPLMLHTLYAATKTLEVVPYLKKERVKRYARLKSSDVVVKGVGDDAQKPRWTLERRRVYDSVFVSMGGRLSYDKCFHHPTRSILAEVVFEHGWPVPMFSTSNLVAPPGGSKGQVTWNSQSAAIAGDPERPRIRFSKFLWRSSPYYYTWRLADRLGIPIAADAAYGGVGVPLVPHRSKTAHVSWLRFLSQRPIEDVVAGMGLAIGEPSIQTFLDRSARQWLKQVLRTSEDSKKYKVTILTHDPLSDEALARKSLSDAYRSALGRVRATEFYFRAPFAGTSHNPSVRLAVRKFHNKVRKAAHTPVSGYGPTIADLDSKSSLYFSTGAGFLPDPWSPPPVASYGMERSREVRVRFKAPHLLGLG
ncbi:MAG: RNA-dependent RNA polymerase [Sclerotinia sclerotiorum narnavirus 4]|nr:MAG: RNA-dependent RNA polymerase [Sclerotinia sclerotiorum narnavirus 4]